MKFPERLSQAINWIMKIVGINHKVGFTYLNIIFKFTREITTKINMMLRRKRSKYIFSIMNEKTDTAESISNLVRGSSVKDFLA